MSEWETGVATVMIKGVQKEFLLDRKHFKTGSVGFYGKDVISVSADEKYIVNVTAVLLGSKPKEK